jgi:glycosyltransferase involved in cell wall biosynthesis
MDIFVLPSYSEGLPLVLIEAMANGLPVVASRVGGIPEIIEHNKSGLLFEAGNYNQLAEKILELYRDLDFYERIRREGFKVAKRNTLEEQVRLLKNPILSIISEIEV